MASEKDRIEEMERYANVLRRSGYDLGTRAQVIEGVMARDRQMAVDNVPYRSGEEIRREKNENKLAHKNTWFLRGGTTSTLMVQPTEGSLLAQKLRRALKGVTAPDGGTTSVLEKAGKSIMAGLTKADPGMKLGCQWTDRTCPTAEKAMC